MKKLSISKYSLWAIVMSLMLPVLSFAQETGSNEWTAGFTTLASEATKMKEAYTGFMTGTMLGVAAAVVAAGVVIWLILRIPRTAGLGKKN